MADVSRDRIDEIADELDDLKTTTDEVADEPPRGMNSKTVDELREALEQASDAADDLENDAGDS